MISYYFFKEKREMVKVPYEQILAFTSAGHYVDIQTMNRTYRQRIAICALEHNIPDYFIRIHRTVIINIHYVIRICKDQVYLNNGETFPISLSYRKEIQRTFIS